MQKHGYPGYESQKHQHDEFVSKVVGLKEDYESGKALISLSMLSFLTTWVNNHIKKEDKQYGPFFTEKGLN
jgi:hemerythrin-like metal-binding protein